MPYRYDWKVHVGNTDFSGLIYAPDAVDAFAISSQELFETIGYPPSRARDEGFIYPAVNVAVDYIDAIRLDDVVALELIPEIGESSVTFDVEGWLEETLVLEGSLTHVFISTETHDPLSIPSEIRAGLQEYA